MKNFIFIISFFIFSCTSHPETVQKQIPVQVVPEQELFYSSNGTQMVVVHDRSLGDMYLEYAMFNALLNSGGYNNVQNHYHSNNYYNQKESYEKEYSYYKKNNPFQSSAINSVSDNEVKSKQSNQVVSTSSKTTNYTPTVIQPTYGSPKVKTFAPNTVTQPKVNNYTPTVTQRSSNTSSASSYKISPTSNSSTKSNFTPSVKKRKNK